MDEWGVDVTVGGSQKGLMLPPGLSFNAISDKARNAARSAKLPRSYWNWDEMLAANQSGYFPYTPATNLLYGLREALRMLQEEGLENVFQRHARHGEATRRAVEAWGLEILCLNPAEYSNSLTAVVVPQGHDADHVREVILQRFDMSLGTGLGKLQGKVTSATSTISRWPARCAAWRWDCNWPACRSSTAVCRRRSKASPVSAVQRRRHRARLRNSGRIVHRLAGGLRVPAAGRGTVQAIAHGIPRRTVRQRFNHQ
jgi:hypothetical protein